MSAPALVTLPTKRASVIRDPTRPDHRLKFIDACRALAAMAVFAFHVTPHLDGLVKSVCGYGWLGVQVFFALSGFVIAHSIGRARITPAYVGNFVLRRSIRLDPPYWLVIGLTLVLIAGSNAVLTDRSLELPSWQAVAAHMVYLQNILGYGDLVDVFWSLAIEVQFYLALILLTGLVQALSPDRKSFRGRAGVVAVLIFAALAALSFGAGPWLGLKPKTWVLNYWNEFFVGVLAAWTLEARVGRVWFFLYVSTLGIASLAITWHIESLTALATACVLLGAGWSGWLTNGLNLPAFQALGRMSYSFYLVHTLVLSRLNQVMVRAGLETVVASLVVVILGLAGSIVVASVLYCVAELPCVRLSKQLRPKPTHAV